jgi:acetyl esterase/lipase
MSGNMAPLPAIPESLLQLMAEVGPKWGQDVPRHVKLMVEKFSEVLARAPNEGIEVTRDLAYGAHERQQLDVFQPALEPAGAGPGRPVLVFVHGGAFVDGEKNRTPEVYSNVLYYAARHGIVGVNVEYRQAPEFKFPSGTDDMRLAIEWTRKNIARFGGNPDRIFLAGHSAGGAHAGSYAYDRRFQPASGPGIVGLIILSGRVRAENLPDNPNARKVEAYYGTDNSVFDDCSMVSHVSKDSVPTMIGIAEYENPLIDVHCAELFHKLAQAKRRAPRIVRLAGHNHTSLIAHINTADERLGREMIEFISLGR